MEKSTDAVGDLERLARALEGVEVGPGLPELAQTRDQLIRAVRGYLIPRRANPQMPLNVVFAGPTGSGKSTLVNSLAGRILTKTGPIRPTTRVPLALVGETSAEPAIGDVEMQRVVGSAPILEKMSLIDTPDIDSTSLEHRVIAESLIDGADVVVFVTSALRYADEAPWQVLRRATSRGAELINVLNRVTAETRGSVVDFRAKLHSAGLPADDLVVISEHHIDSDHERVPSLAARSLSRRLVDLAVARSETGRGVFDRVRTNVVERANDFGRALNEAEDSLASLEAELDISLNSRPGRLEWPVEVAVTFPKSARRRALRRWRKQRDRAVTAPHVDLIVGTVRSDLMAWAADSASSTLELEGIAAVIHNSLPVLESAVKGWLEGLESIVTSRQQGDWGTVARSSLIERIEVVYRHVSIGVIEISRSAMTVTGTERLLETLRSRIDA